jgi:hypothetical protein
VANQDMDRGRVNKSLHILYCTYLQYSMCCQEGYSEFRPHMMGVAEHITHLAVVIEGIFRNFKRLFKILLVYSSVSTYR